MYIPAKSNSQASLLVGQSQAVQSLRRLIESLAASTSTALITGESGTGKELVAQMLHRQGPRADASFVPLNCGAIPKELIESELFGHRKGAFTGAIADRLGRFELAHGGTLFLDEIGDLPMDMQVKLLRVLQERCILPVGASKEVPVDVRVIAATHKNLESEVSQGRFREDLYYRLNVLPIHTSPLRERSDDIELLLNHYAQKHALPGQKPIRFEAQMINLLCQYEWPGNVREISNLVDRFSTLFPGQQIEVQRIPTCMLPPGLARIQAEHLSRMERPTVVPLSALYGEVVESWADSVSLPPGAQWGPAADQAEGKGSLNEMAVLLGHMQIPGSSVCSPALLGGKTQTEASNDEINAVEEAIFLAQGIQTLPPDGISLKQHLIDIERSLIEQALARTSGNVSKTAKLLQLQRTTLIEKINKYDLRSSG
ncbi:MAG: Nitrogen assimilation regulatory protein [Pseudomonadota bacterium]|jgi:sigma-54 specific flagellar transcriptional regulator A